MDLSDKIGTKGYKRHGKRGAKTRLNQKYY